MHTSDAVLSRVPEATIKKGLLHSEKIARQEASSYFSSAFSRDAEVMPLAIEALEVYGRRQAFQYTHGLADLTQSLDTVRWLVHEIQNDPRSFVEFHAYYRSLSHALCNADPRIVAPHIYMIFNARGFDRRYAPIIERRIEQMNWDADRCWSELHAAFTVDEETDETHFARANPIVDALAPQGGAYVDQILEMLGVDLPEYADDSELAFDASLARLAGLMRLENAVPSLAKRLKTLPTECSIPYIHALVQIGTDEVVEAVAQSWRDADFVHRLDAASVLERVHNDASARILFELLSAETDRRNKTVIAHSLLAQLTPEAIEPVRQLVRTREYDERHSDLMFQLVSVSALVGVDFPEYRAWKREAETRQAEVERKMWQVFEGCLRDPRAANTSRTEQFDKWQRQSAPIRRDKGCVGRNDPCPCGSGKKFKRCCMKG
jgi:hypothetical protein